MKSRLFLSFVIAVAIQTVAFAVELSDAEKSVQEASKVMDRTVKPQSCNCEADSAQAPVSMYETCTAENDYLEKLIPEVKSQVVPKNVTGFSSKCILHAQKGFPSGPLFINCPSKNAFPSPKKRIDRACISEKYHKHVANAFIAATDCFKVPPQQLFVNLSIESGLHINALGRALDAGISQLTGPTIDAINKLYFQSYKERAKKSPNCSAVVPAMEPLPSETSVRCAAIQPPDNPLKNLIYAAILYDTNSQVIRAGIKSVKDKLPADLDTEALIQACELLSFNASPGNIMLVLRQYVKERGKNLKAADFKLDQTLEGSFLEYVSKNYPVGPKETEDRRRVVANYLPLAKRYVSRIEALEQGLSCGSKQLSKLF